MSETASPARRAPWRLGAAMPKGLYTRSLLIIVTPIILLQVVLAIVFMDRHYELVSRQLSNGLAQEVGTLADLYEAGQGRVDRATLQRIAREQLKLQLQFLPPSPPAPSSAVPGLWGQNTLYEQLDAQLAQSFSIHPGQDDAIDIRVYLPGATMEVIARRSQAFVSNWHIFIVWMLATSSVLLAIAILFLRNQIRPILRLAAAAEAFGKGRDVPEFKPRGAREVRRAAIAFAEMRSRIERQIEQRTTMLAGVSHDLRTILTRFRLQLALLEPSSEVDDLSRDVDEMTRMLEDYLAFARGDAGEQPADTDVLDMLRDLQAETQRGGRSFSLTFSGNPKVILRTDAFKRCMMNVLTNALRFGRRVSVTCSRDEERLTILVDDDGPGIPPEEREEVFRPFVRLDHARNQDHPGSGLGLAIARDIARGHGGDVSLVGSPLGGLRAIITVPV